LRRSSTLKRDNLGYEEEQINVIYDKHSQEGQGLQVVSQMAHKPRVRRTLKEAQSFGVSPNSRAFKEKII